MTDKATPRPWSEGEDIYDVPVICAGAEIIARFTHTPTQKARALADRALTLAAVNSFDEREALLREAAERILAIRHKSDCSCADCIQADDLRLRIRTALGETDAK